MLHKSVWPAQLYSYNGWLREFGLSLAAIKRLLSRVEMDDLSNKTEQLKLGKIEALIILISEWDDYDEEFATTVTSCDEQKTKSLEDRWLRQAQSNENLHSKDNKAELKYSTKASRNTNLLRAIIKRSFVRFLHFQQQNSVAPKEAYYQICWGPRKKVLK